MARWKLMANHYLNVTEKWTWEYSEVNRRTGRPIRKTFTVPRFINVLDPGDWTRQWGPKDEEEGEVIVCLPSKGDDRDIEFIGDPTPDMMPIDDEAKAISAGFAELWSYKPETAEISHSQSMIDRNLEAIAEAQSKPQQIEVPGLTELVAILAEGQKQNAELIKSLATRRL